MLLTKHAWPDMSNLSRLLLVGLLAGVFAWGVFFASIEQQAWFSRFAQSAVRDGPQIAVSAVQRAGYLFGQLLE